MPACACLIEVVPAAYGNMGRCLLLLPNSFHSTQTRWVLPLPTVLAIAEEHASFCCFARVFDILFSKTC